MEEAIRSHDIETVVAALRTGTSANGETTTGMPLLEFAALLGQINIVRALIEAGADVNQRGQLGSTALMAAASLGQGLVVRVLLEHGADPDVVDYEGKISSRPIWHSVFSADSDLDTLRALIDGGADTAGVDEHGMSLSDWATPAQREVLRRAQR